MRLHFLLIFFVSVWAMAQSPDSAGGSGALESCRDGLKIASISLSGLEHTNTRVVMRELSNQEGAPFSREKFESEKLELEDLDLFTDISLNCEDVNGKLNLTYSFKEIFRWIPSPAGKTTDRDGLMVGLALANLNVLGEDIRAEVQYRTAVDPIFESNEYAFYASSPYLMGLPLWWNLEFSHTDSWDDIRRFQDASWLLDLDLKWKMKPHFSLLATGVYRYLEEGPGVLPEAGAGFSLDFRDRELDTRKGVYFEYMLTHVGVGAKGSNENHEGENFWELLGDVRSYVTFGRFVTGAYALVRYRPGTVQQYDDYCHGGTNSFRGHYADSNSIGVHEALLTLEERFVLRERKAASIFGVNFFYGLQLVAGLDGSLLWDEGAPGWKDYEGAVYGGIHLVIPALDRIRFEVGYSPDTGEPKFMFGLFDKTVSQRWRSR